MQQRFSTMIAYCHGSILKQWDEASGFTSRCPKNCKISWFQLFYSTTNLALFSSFFQLKTNLGFLKIRHEACSWDIEFLVFPFHFWEESFDEMFTLLVKFESTIIEQRSSNSIAAAATAAAIAVEGRRKRMEVRRRQQLLSNSPWSSRRVPILFRL